MPAFPKPTATETDPVASPAATTAQARADAAFDLAGTKARPILPWATATAYLRGEAVTNGGHTYTANDAHTSGATFAGDLATHWTPLPIAVADVTGAAPTASPALTGNPTAPTQTAGNNSTRLATTAYADAAAAAVIAAADAMVFKGAIDCSASPNYPAADAGHTYRVSVAGKIGGASGVNVEVNDLAMCTADGTAAGNQATVGSAWVVVQANIDGAVTGPASAVSARLASFSGTSGKVIQDAGVAVDTDGAFTADSDARLATQKAVRTYAAAALAAIPVNLVAGRYSALTPAAAAATLSGGTIYGNALGQGVAWPVVFNRDGTLTRLALSVTTLAASSKARIAIWADNGGVPGALILDAGQIDGATTGIKELTISQAVRAGVVYWFSVTLQGATGLQIRHAPVVGVGQPETTNSAIFDYGGGQGVFFTGETGAHSANAPGTLGASQGATASFQWLPRLAVKG